MKAPIFIFVLFLSSAFEYGLLEEGSVFVSFDSPDFLVSLPVIGFLFGEMRLCWWVSSF